MSHLLREWSVERAAANPEATPGMARLRETTQLHFELIETTLAASPYFAGEAFSAADVMMLFPFTTMQKFRALDLSPYPATVAYIARIEARPAYQRAMAVAGPGVKAE